MERGAVLLEPSTEVQRGRCWLKNISQSVYKLSRVNVSDGVAYRIYVHTHGQNENIPPFKMDYVVRLERKSSINGNHVYS